LTLIRTEVRA